MTERRAAIYARISQDREGAGLGIDRQLADCLAITERLGWRVVAIHRDNDISAYSGKPRPGYRTLLADLEAGRADAVVVWHTDRLHRSPRELEEYVDLCERKKVTTQTVKAGELDLATPSGRAVARTLGAWARFEVEHKSERTKRAQLQAATAGKWLGGAPPLGWNVRADGTASLDPIAATAIQQASVDILAGASLGSVVRSWNARGFTSRTGRPWNYSTLRQVLTRARNAGLVEYRGEIVAKSHWPTIVSEDTWRALCGLFADPSRRRSQSNRARWLLSGIALCGADDCGGVLRSATATGGAGLRRTIYRCAVPGRGHVARSAVDTDALVRAVVSERLRRPDLRDLLPRSGETTSAADLRGEAVSLRARLDEAAESFSEGHITAAQLATISSRVKGKLADVDGRLASMVRGGAFDGLVNVTNPAAAWAALPLDRQRAVVSELLTVTVLPGLRGRVFDPSLIRIEGR